ncbi:MAG: prolipoprotein diacylglyceryl transferase [Planctomycetaceae bacterium]|nr:prolipoprotein diacylglyceryl transferase [Planctomycetaceae bacterium]
MLPIIVDFGTPEWLGLPLRVYGYGLMMVLGFVCGIALARWRARRCGEDPDVFTQCGIFALIGGVVGARLAFVIQEVVKNHHDPSYSLSLGEMLNITSGGLIYYGGVILAAIMVLAYLVAKRLPVRRHLDILAVSLMVGLAFGRAGCLLNGCCYGGRCSEEWPLGMHFPMYAQPLVNLDTGAGPFSAHTGGPSPVYSQQLKDRALALLRQGTPDGPAVLAAGPTTGVLNPDWRLMEHFASAYAPLESSRSGGVYPILQPRATRVLHGRLTNDQLATVHMDREAARRLFAAVSDHGQLDQRQWNKALAEGTGFLRGSEQWDDARMFDAGGDGRLDFDEAWNYLTTRYRLLSQLAPSLGAASPATRTAARDAAINAYLQADQFDLALHSHTLAVKPAQALGIINALLLAALLTVLYRHRLREGMIFAMLMVVYPMTRFVQESIRSDNAHDLARGILTHNQYTSIALMAMGTIMVLVIRFALAPSNGPTLAQRRAG